MSTSGRSRTALSFDVGGTFTDFVAVDAATGEIVGRHKVLTNARYPARGIVRGWQDMAATGIDAPSVSLCVHSTTLVTNALIERRGARTVLLATRGFRDVLEIGREQMYDIYDLFAPPPEPLIPRPLRLEIDERMDANGKALRSPTPESIADAIDAIQALQAESVAIAFLHAYLNPEHELAIADAVAAALPGISISTSASVAPIVGEYERTSTTVADAFARPGVSAYVGELQHSLTTSGVTAPLHLMLSSGEIASAATATAHPIRLLESGPAAGAIAAAFFGRLAGRMDVLSLDMGGTTAKACVIEGGMPEMAQELEVARVRRFMKGSGLPVVTPVIDLIEIGAGGGSIARRDELGLLKVGPESSGADPGPACYGLGGTEPTVSDANLVLGYLNPDFFLGGSIPLRADRARMAISALAETLGMTIDETAWGIYRVVNENMAAAARVHIIERNRDPRSLTTIAFGGAGPAHAVAVARILGSPTVIFPPGAGVASAFGALVAPVSFTAGRTLMTRLDRADWNAINEMYAQLERDARAELAHAGVERDTVTTRRWAEMRLEGQYHEISVDLPGGDLGPDSMPTIQAAFNAVYVRQYGRVLEGLPVESLHWRLSAVGPERQIEIKRHDLAPPDATPAVKAERDVWFPGGYRVTPVYDRDLLRPGMVFIGPAIVEEREATAVIWPGDSARVDEYLAIVLTVGTAERTT
ncbi:MAG TPA: hydantoinase/oxoprolinase family protein [Thermomicrobiales bacterium]|nr:hydantoinase/oxoprolinase family protein [Thermomicrobiales bacterium]